MGKIPRHDRWVRELEHEVVWFAETTLPINFFLIFLAPNSIFTFPRSNIKYKNFF